MFDATAISFVAFLLIFIGIGVYSATRKKETAEDYLLASRSVNPWMTALSAVATNNSGFMFMGLIAEAYLFGISSMWLMVGWVAGDWMAWFVVHKPLRIQSEKSNSNTIPSFLAAGLENGHLVAIVAGLITLVFLGLYAGAQLSAGGKALHSVFDWNVEIGATVGAVIVAAYCFSGGIRASIWTDVAQSIVMIIAMVLLFTVALIEVGGFAEMWSQLEAIDPKLVEIAPSDFKFGFAGYLLGWMGAGAGVVGQPHVMIRAMALDDPNNMPKARRIYVTWYSIFAATCILVGLAARVLIPETPADPELALPILSEQLLAPVLVGLILAGLFSATISTADSQILSCSAAVTHDLFPKLGQRYAVVKMATLGVTAFALLLVLSGNKSVFKMVVLAWSALASGLGPLMVARALRWPISTPIALAMMIIGVAGALFWKYVLEYSGDMYEVLPGMVAGFLTYVILVKLMPPSDSASKPT